MMKANRISSIALAATLCCGVTLQAQAQSPSKGYDKESSVATDVKIKLTNLLAQTRRQGPPFFNLMRESPAVNVGEPMFSVGRMAAGSSLIVQGSGILGRLTKWTGFTSSNSFIGDSTIFEDKFGKVGIGTDSPTSRLTVAGLIETASGGVKFPDGTVQTTAGIGANDAVKSLNGLKGDVLLAGSANITVASAGNTITVTAPNVLTEVTHNNTLTGEGTAASPLSVVQAATMPVQFSFDSNIRTFTVPMGKLLVIEFFSGSGLFLNEPNQTDRLTIGVQTMLGSELVTHFVIGVRSFAPATGAQEFGFSSIVRLYADPGTEVRLTGSSQLIAGNFKLSGHFVNVPSDPAK